MAEEYRQMPLLNATQQEADLLIQLVSRLRWLRLSIAFLGHGFQFSEPDRHISDQPMLATQSLLTGQEIGSKVHLHTNEFRAEGFSAS